MERLSGLSVMDVMCLPYTHFETCWNLLFHGYTRIPRSDVANITWEQGNRRWWIHIHVCFAQAHASFSHHPSLIKSKFKHKIINISRHQLQNIKLSARSFWVWAHMRLHRFYAHEAGPVCNFLESGFIFRNRTSIWRSIGWPMFTTRRNVRNYKDTW